MIIMMPNVITWSRDVVSGPVKSASTFSLGWIVDDSCISYAESNSKGTSCSRILGLFMLHCGLDLFIK